MSINRRDVSVKLVLTLLVAGLAYYQFSIPPRLNGAVIDPPRPMPAFTLQSAKGLISSNSFRGKLVVLYFGYTSCPDICPLTLANLRQAMDKIGDDSKDVQVVFISVDWKRDTAEKMSVYTSLFRPDFLGLAGTQAQIDAVTKEYGIYYLLNLPDSKGFYSVDHTATVLVLDRMGQLNLTWLNGTSPEAMASDLKILINR